MAETRYYDRIVNRPGDLPFTRQDFLSSIAEPEGLATARLDVLRLLSDGVPDRGKPVRALDMLRIQGLQMPQEERFQPVVDSSGDGQAYFFGRNVRMYQISAYMIDTNLDAGQQQAAGDMAGHLLVAWKRAYEEVRAPVLARRKHIIRLTWHRSESFGYILSQVPSMDASQPNVCQIGMVFLSVCDRHYAVPTVQIANPRYPGDVAFPGLLTYGAATRLFPHLTGQDITRIGRALVRSIVTEALTGQDVTRVGRAVVRSAVIPKW